MKPCILFIMHMPPPVHGAAIVGKYIHDSRVINEAFDCHYINLTTAQDLADIGKIGIKKVGAFIRLLRKIRDEVKRLRPQLVYVTPNAKGGAFYKDFVVVEMLKRMGCRIVVHYHNKGVSTRQDRWLDDMLYRRFFKGLKVILLAEALYADVEKYVPRKDVWICPNGIPETLGSGEEVPPRKNSVPRLLFLSNLLVSKGVLVLLDALVILKERGYSFVCDFVGGETGEIDALRFRKEVEERRLDGIVVFKGRKYGKEKDAFLRNADVFVFPTYYNNETFGLVNLEAMEYRLPIVTTAEGGIPDVVKDGENGLISEKRNLVSLADCIEKLLKDTSLREKMGKNGYEKFKQNFTLSSFENTFIKCVNECYRGGVKWTVVFYHGSKYGKEKKVFWRNADVFVFPTFYHNECFPLVLLEAMQHGLPCIASDEGGISNIVEDGVTGFVIEKENVLALADKMETLLKDPRLCQRMGEAGRVRFEEHFSLNEFERRITDVLLSILRMAGKDFFYRPNISQ